MCLCVYRKNGLLIFFANICQARLVFVMLCFGCCSVNLLQGRYFCGRLMMSRPQVGWLNDWARKGLCLWLLHHDRENETELQSQSTAELFSDVKMTPWRSWGITDLRKNEATFSEKVMRPGELELWIGAGFNICIGIILEHCDESMGLINDCASEWMLVGFLNKLSKKWVYVVLTIGSS